ncbi:MAG: tRNA (N6-threonylcarbamoyladenosine(37)-N6)-methyltransferase TrmO, partial [Deltaproteobacteria bacterium HGW-Deltaproteobacteria-17]
MTEDLFFSFRAIGWVRSPYARRIDAPHQGTVVEGTETGALAEASLELAPWLGEKVLQDLAG